MGDRSFGGIFDRNDSVVGAAAGDFVEDFCEVGKGGVIDGVAEFLDRGLMGPGAFGAEIGNFEVVLEREGGGHDLAVNGANGFLGEAALAHPDQFGEEGVFALGGINLQAFGLFDFADFVDQIGTLIEQVEELFVDCVDSGSDVVECHGGEIVCREGEGPMSKLRCCGLLHFTFLGLRCREIYRGCFFLVDWWCLRGLGEGELLLRNFGVSFALRFACRFLGLR